MMFRKLPSSSFLKKIGSRQLSINVLNDLKNVVGQKLVVTSDAVREQHGRDEGPYRADLPDVVVFPQDTHQVSEVVKMCHKHSLPVIPYGTGTGLEGGVNAIKGGVCLNLTQMDLVTKVDPLNFYVSVQPGVTRNALNHHIKDTGLWFPIDPGADASLCGMAATSASGTNAVRYGTMKECVMNMEVVVADGSIVHTAGKGRATKKSAAGYNLTNLFVGSEGTLGVITETTLKLFAVPDAMVAAVCGFPSIEAAVTTTVQTLQSSIPIARIELLDEVAMKASNAYSKTSYHEVPTLFMEFHGSTNEVKAQAEAVGEIASSNGGSDFQYSHRPEERNKLWKARHDMFYACLALRPGVKALVTDVCVPITELPEVVHKCKDFIKDSGLIGPILGHVGDGNFHSILLFNEEDSQEYKAAKTVYTSMAECALDYGGTCTGEHGVGKGKIKFVEKQLGKEAISVMKTLKTALDPKGIMNPGKVLNM